jgi:hypothetical protein
VDAPFGTHTLVARFGTAAMPQVTAVDGQFGPDATRIEQRRVGVVMD